jgi:NAD(P)H-hydrate repair Nnr-like enzyme with NAD(P)H-hydrate dehydratase domain
VLEFSLGGMVIKRLKDSQAEDFLKKADFLAGKSMIIGGSSLFHGAPLLSLQAASRFNQTVFFTSPESSLSQVARQIKGQLFSFIWAPFRQVESYLASVDIALIGPGFMRYSDQGKVPKKRQELDSLAGEKTKRITERLLNDFFNLPWVIDAGSLQVIKKEIIPPGAIVTPNNEEFKVLFGDDLTSLSLADQVKVVISRARESNCLVVSKNPDSVIAYQDDYLVVSGGNQGLEKGGTGDVLAGLVMALSAKAKLPLLSSAVAVWLFKRAAEKLSYKQGLFYNADDLSSVIASSASEYLD